MVIVDDDGRCQLNHTKNSTSLAQTEEQSHEIKDFSIMQFEILQSHGADTQQSKWYRSLPEASFTSICVLTMKGPVARSNVCLTGIQEAIGSIQALVPATYCCGDWS